MKKQTLSTLCCLLLMAACRQPLTDDPVTLDGAKLSVALLAVPDYATVTITNVKSGKYLETGGSPTLNEKFKDNAQLQQWQFSGPAGQMDNWQKWHVIYQTTAGGVKYYHLRNLYSGKLLDVPSGTAASGTILQQYTAFPLPADQQLWRLQDLGNGQYKIFNKGNGLALSVQGGSTANGAKVIQETTVNDTKQQWTVSTIAADTWRDDEVVRFFHRNSASLGSSAFDQGNTIPLTWSGNNGKVLWVTQDAWDGSQVQPNGMFNCGAFHSYSNSVFIQPSKTNWNPNDAPNMTITTSTSGKPKQIFNIQPGTAWTWSGPGIEIGDKVYVQCGEGNGLNATGQSLYRLTQSTGTQWISERFLPNGFSGTPVINYSTGMVKPGDGYVYAFGSEGISFNYESYIHVARFHVNTPLQWEYYNGSTWTASPSPGSAAKVTTGKGSNSVAYLNGKYIHMTMDQGFNCETTRNIYISTSSSPLGPFTTPVKVYTIQEYFKGQYARYYTPVVHPEFDNGRQELLLTYCLNFSGCGLESCEGAWLDPYYYRVKAIRVPYGKIGL
ncbi:RICIN domain-containing protein [Chitinophaga sp. YIM B06452]|uniref:RICIN domain-containing protein n=1 Tax=Chitinophaga sp. YIM B06452 TaxID=3082158 RepID=UPI0031FEA27B